MLREIFKPLKKIWGRRDLKIEGHSKSHSIEKLLILFLKNLKTYLLSGNYENNIQTCSTKEKSQKW